MATMMVADLMTPAPHVVGPDTTVMAALALLDAHDIRHLPVIDPSGMLLSIISDRDLRPITDPAMIGDAALVRLVLQRPVEAVLKRLAVAVNPDTPAAEAAAIMVDERVGALPVVAEDSGDLLGIVSYVDLLRGAFDLP